MHSARVLKLVVAALSATSATQGFFINVAMFGRDTQGLVERQGNNADGTGSGNTVAVTPTSETTSQEPTTTSSTTSTSSAETTAPTTTPAEPTTTSATTTDATPTTTSTSNDAPPPTTEATTTSAGSPTTTSDSSVSTTESATPITSTTVIVVTASDGSLSSSTSTSVSTPTATLSNAGSNNGGGSGMSTQTRNTIIGVVVGVGGAIVLAVAGVFAWRIWGRKRHSEENDGLMGYTAGTEGKSEVGALGAGSTVSGNTGRSPFQSTLESYHAPTRPERANPSANF